mmetsp:Transcript_10280/g.26940  ORF Transcript_10280/g.26940 Transcript_10280/m.26940 type:complete len:451 (-) Transcript_10280:802-2154(-)
MRLQREAYASLSFVSMFPSSLCRALTLFSALLPLVSLAQHLNPSPFLYGTSSLSPRTPHPTLFLHKAETHLVLLRCADTDFQSETCCAPNDFEPVVVNRNVERCTSCAKCSTWCSDGTNAKRNNNKRILCSGTIRWRSRRATSFYLFCPAAHLRAKITPAVARFLTMVDFCYSETKGNSLSRSVCQRGSDNKKRIMGKLVADHRNGGGREMLLREKAVHEARIAGAKSEIDVSRPFDRLNGDSNEKRRARAAVRKKNTVDREINRHQEIAKEKLKTVGSSVDARPPPTAALAAELAMRREKLRKQEGKNPELDHIARRMETYSKEAAKKKDAEKPFVLQRPATAPAMGILMAQSSKQKVLLQKQAQQKKVSHEPKKIPLSAAADPVATHTNNEKLSVGHAIESDKPQTEKEKSIIAIKNTLLDMVLSRELFDVGPFTLYKAAFEPGKCFQ